MMNMQSRIMRDSIPVPEAGCWLWERAICTGGYGQLRVDGVATKAHRASWLAFRGEIPEGMFACHRCDTPSCVNPDHLFIGSALDNARDRDKKGRANSCKGAKHGRSKLNVGQVVEIRRRYMAGEKQKDLAAEFGVGRPQLHRIVKNQRWTLEI